MFRHQTTIKKHLLHKLHTFVHIHNDIYFFHAVMEKKAQSSMLSKMRVRTRRSTWKKHFRNKCSVFLSINKTDSLLFSQTCSHSRTHTFTDSCEFINLTLFLHLNFIAHSPPSSPSFKPVLCFILSFIGSSVARSLYLLQLFCLCDQFPFLVIPFPDIS